MGGGWLPGSSSGRRHKHNETRLSVDLTDLCVGQLVVDTAQAAAEKEKDRRG